MRICAAYHEILVPVPILVEEKSCAVSFVLVHGTDIREVGLKNKTDKDTLSINPTFKTLKFFQHISLLHWQEQHMYSLSPCYVRVYSRAQWLATKIFFQKLL
jgi:hypothetical protein